MLETNAQIVDETLTNKSLVGRTEIRDDASGTRAVLEYQIKTMNILRKPIRYQVDSGPIIVPDFGSTAGMQVERFDIAHVVYNRPYKGEFILRRPKGGRRGQQAGVLGPGAGLPGQQRAVLRGVVVPRAMESPVRRGVVGRQRSHQPLQRPGLRPLARR